MLSEHVYILYSPERLHGLVEFLDGADEFFARHSYGNLSNQYIGSTWWDNSFAGDRAFGKIEKAEIRKWANADFASAPSEFNAGGSLSSVVDGSVAPYQLGPVIGNREINIYFRFHHPRPLVDTHGVFHGAPLKKVNDSDQSSYCKSPYSQVGWVWSPHGLPAHFRIPLLCGQWVVWLIFLRLAAGLWIRSLFGDNWRMNAALLFAVLLAIASATQLIATSCYLVDSINVLQKTLENQQLPVYLFCLPPVFYGMGN